MYSNFNDTEAKNKYIFAKITRIKALNRIPENLKQGDWVRGYMTYLPKVGSVINLAQEEKNGRPSVDLFTSGVVKDVTQDGNVITVLTENSEYSVKILEN